MKKMKFETKVTVAAVVIPAVVTLLALAPFPQGIKIIGDLVFQERGSVATTPVAGTGTFYVKNTTPSTPIFVNDVGTEITLGEAGAGGQDPTYGSDAGAVDDAVYVDDENRMGIGTITPLEDIWIYRTDNAPRLGFQYFSTGGSGTETHYPGTASYAAPGTQTWSGHTTNLAADDNVIAASLIVFGGPAYTQTLKTTGYNFTTVPVESTIVGVEVKLGITALQNESIDTGAYLVVGGTVQTETNKATNTLLADTETVITYGGPTDDWMGLTPAQVNASDFGFAWQGQITTTSDTIQIDYITIKVYYTTGIAGDQTWTMGDDISDGAFTIRGNGVDLFRMAYAGGDVDFAGVVDADGYKQDGVLYDLSTFGSGGGITGPVSSTSRAIATWGDTTGDSLLDNTVGIDVSGNITLATGDTVDGRELSTDGAKLDGIEPGATADQSNAEIETAYNAQVAVASQAEAEAGTSTTVKRFTPQRIGQAIAALAPQQTITLNSDVTGSGTGGITAIIANDVVSNAKLAEMAEGRWKYRRPGMGSGNPTDNTAANMVDDLDVAYADGELVDLGTASTGTSTTITCDFEPGKFYVYKVTLADNSTVVTSGSTLVAGNKFILIVTQDGSGGNTLDFSNIYFRFSTDIPEPTIPTTAASQSVYAFMYIGGSKYSLMAYNQGF